jgi:hypothetical protein
LLLAAATAAFAQSESDFEVSVADGAVTITKYTGKGGRVVIPERIQGLPVTSIGENAFYNCTSLTGVSLPAGVTSIGVAAFSGCIGLTSISIPASVTSIELDAFDGCARLVSEQSGFKVIALGGAGGRVIIDNYYTGTAAAVVIPARIGGLPVTNIEWYVFSGCIGITSVSIPASVTSIGGWAFFHCSGLTSISIPASVTSIELDAFDGCARLVSEQSGFKVIALGGAGGRVIITGYTGTAAAVVIPARIQGLPVTAIGDVAFADNKLTSVTIPNSVTTIDGWAFDENPLVSITIEANVNMVVYQDDYTGMSYWVFDNVFDYYYDINGKKAGKYTFRGGDWSYSAQ